MWLQNFVAYFENDYSVADKTSELVLGLSPNFATPGSNI
jgi:hypothetical protein